MQRNIDVYMHIITLTTDLVTTLEKANIRLSTCNKKVSCSRRNALDYKVEDKHKNKEERDSGLW